MLATLGGLLALPLGLIVLLLPLLAPELSRPRDSAWGAVVLLLGLDLVTTADRLTGAPMLGVLCGALLFGRLGLEVGQGRWRQLSEEERQRLGSLERWSTSFRQLAVTAAGLLERAGAGMGNLTSGIGSIAAAGDRSTAVASGQAAGAGGGRGGTRKGKRWVRPETPAASSEPGTDPAPPPAGRTGGDAATPSVQDAARAGASGSFAAAPAPEAAEGPRSPSELPGHSEPVATAMAGSSPASPSALLPAPTATDQPPEPAAETVEAVQDEPPVAPAFLQPEPASLVAPPESVRPASPAGEPGS